MPMVRDEVVGLGEKTRKPLLVSESLPRLRMTQIDQDACLAEQLKLDFDAAEVLYIS